MSKCRYEGCEYDDSAHRPYSRKRDGIPSASHIAGLLDTGKSRSFSWAASLIASTVAVHHPDQWQGLIGHMSDRAWQNGHTECGHEKNSLCKACTYLRSAHDREWTAKANKGSHLHHLALSWAQGEAVDVDDHIAPYMDALEKFYMDCEPEFLHLESSVLYDEPKSHAYRGQFDFVAKLTRDHERRTGLWDIKSGSYWPVEQTLQLSGYRYSKWITTWEDGKEIKVKPMPAVQEAGVLLLHDDGTYHLQALPANGDAHGTFLRLRDAWGWSQTVEKWAKDNPLGEVA